MKTDLFITGASGLLGTRVLERLDPQRYGSITLLCRSMPALPEQLAQAANVSVIRASLHEAERYQHRLTAQTRILHMAAVTGKADRPQYFSINTHATGLLIRAAERAQVAGFLYISSVAVSFRDRRGYHYAESKEQAEELLRASTLRYCILRPTIILGPAAPIWKSFLALASRGLIVLPGNGRTRIQPIYLDDMARLLEDLLARDDFSNQLLEIGGPEVLTLDDFMQRIHRAVTGKRALILHLPLGLVLGPLRLLETFMAGRMPVSSGQFASFHNDGIVLINETPTLHDPPMLGVDEMLARMLAAGATLPATGTELAVECRVFARYLTGRAPADYVREKYQQAFDGLQQQRLGVRDRFDTLLLRLARIHPLLTHATDSYSRLLRADSVVRRRLIMLLAILETHAGSVNRLDRPDCHGIAGLVLGMGMRGIGSMLLLLPALLLLLPLQLLLGRRNASTRAA
jgi:NADH dehydrogenase